VKDEEKKRVVKGTEEQEKTIAGVLSGYDGKKKHSEVMAGDGGWIF